MDGQEPARRFEDLIVWRKSHVPMLTVYKYSAGFPNSERYGLTSQLRRAAVSMPANIAEGFKRRSRADKVRFLNIAQGSLEETRYFLILAADLDYGNGEGVKSQLAEVARLLESYTSTVEASIRSMNQPHD